MIKLTRGSIHGGARQRRASGCGPRQRRRSRRHPPTATTSANRASSECGLLPTRTVRPAPDPPDPPAATRFPYCHKGFMAGSVLKWQQSPCHAFSCWHVDPRGSRHSVKIDMRHQWRQDRRPDSPRLRGARPGLCSRTESRPKSAKQVQTPSWACT